jgi:protoporphyrinogen oxidase
MSRVAILGGGYAGLGAALRLAELGHEAIVLEAAKDPGGLGGAAVVGGLPVEHFYHHMKPEDVHVLALIERVGLGDRVRWVDTRMGFLEGGRLHPFSSPLDLLTFKPFSPVDRVRFALGVLKAKRTDGRTLVDRDAESWIVAEWGRTIYDRMMRQMLLNKFGIEPREISAAFLQGRIKGLSSSKKSYKGGERFAYLDGSNQLLTDRLVALVAGMAEIRTATPVRRIDHHGDGFKITTDAETLLVDRVVNTLAMTAFAKVEKGFPFTHTIRYQGAINGIFVLEETVTDLYWINVLDPGITFRVLVNQSMLGSYPKTVLYCGNYVAPDTALFRSSSEEIAALYRADLEKIFGRLTVVDHAVFRTPVATPIFDKDFGPRLDHVRGQVPGMVFAGNAFIYPGTRTLSSVFRTGLEAAETIAAEVARAKAA